MGKWLSAGGWWSDSVGFAVPGRIAAITILFAATMSAFAYPSSQKATETQSVDAAHAVELDHVVAIVGDQVILQSDLEDEMRFTALQSSALPASENTDEDALNRLIDRDLINRERLLQPAFSVVSNQQVDASIVQLKKDIPACAHDACSTSDGWKAFLQTQGFTEQEVYDRMRQRLQILKFINWRFGATVRVSQADVKTYYQKVLLPEFAHEKTDPPPVGKVAARIREILQQQHITALLNDWLKNLRSQGEVHIVDRAYASVGGSS
ncbi:MAG TPA: SurA N-terminal domain-containing protein [Acidobacteriaceae bacterium]|jgi:hypothetical protein|nr:SurA N-terminal domain-containing protein [Acidobacteriaceae bacterium]